jgi:transposase
VRGICYGQRTQGFYQGIQAWCDSPSDRQGHERRKAAFSLGIRECLLRKLKAKWEAKGEEAFPGHGNQNSRDKEVVRLMAENRQLRTEGDILKKATAFFAKHAN